jgi:putative Holliday junction resolvase
MERIKPSRIIGIDFGMARIGLAVSDEQKIIATPLTTLKADKKSEKTVALLLQFLEKDQSERGYRIEEIVIGLPLMMSGKVGMLADEVKHFVELLKKIIEVPIITWDERLTTVIANRSLRESSFTRKRRAKEVDSVAALIILQNYLDSKSIHAQRMESME